jgi:hypothetical protein
MPAAAVAKAKINPRFLPAIDLVLITGARLGTMGKKQAINKVLQLVPEWRRGDCWRRIRQLRRTSLIPHLELPPAEPKTSGLHEPNSAPRQPVRPWSAEEDAKLLDWAGYEPVNKIAQRLGRSVRAVRFRLGALGMSARVSDGWSLRSLRKLLHVGPAKIRHFIGTGMLRVRDPRISSKLIVKLCSTGVLSADSRAVERLRKCQSLPWDRVAEVLGISIDQVQDLICQGKLKVLDPFVTDRSFEEFCRRHGDQINLAFIDPRSAKWLVEEYGISCGSNIRIVSRSQKHALVVRACKCGRKITGNIFFKHVKHCSVAKGQTKAPAEAGALNALGKRPLEAKIEIARECSTNSTQALSVSKSLSAGSGSQSAA